MRIYYGTVFFIETAVLIMCAVKAYRENSKMAIAVRKILVFALLAVIENLILVFFKNKTVSMLVYGMLFATVDWLLYYILRFSMEYIGNSMEDYVKIKAMKLILAADSISMILNVIFLHGFQCKRATVQKGYVYYIIEGYLPYYIHLAITYMLIIFTIITLMYKIIRVPYLYKNKYITVLFMILVVVLGNVMFIVVGGGIDSSILSYAIVAIMIYYYSLVHKPKRLLNKTLSMVVYDMADAVILFDIDGKWVSANKSAYKFFAPFQEEGEKLADTIAKWCSSRQLNISNNCTYNFTDVRHGMKFYFNLQCNRLEDKRKKYLGSFIIIRDYTEEVKKHEKERYMASHDSLTDIYNKEYFYNRAEKHIKENPLEEYFIVCSNIKNFKIINDIFGKKKGDEILKKFGRLLKSGKVMADVYGRLGDDRFGMLIKKSNFNEDDILEKLHSTVYIDTNISYRVNIHIGIYEVKNRDLSVLSMCDRAFMAIETIKGDFQKKAAYYDERLRDNALKEQELAGEIENAIDTGQFTIYLQPQMNKDGEVLGAEALVRWLHPTKGLIMPGGFIGILEKSGMIARLDKYVWELACIKLREWKNQGITNMYISVNISPRDFYFLDIYKIFTELIDKYGIQPKNLKLEITETAIMMNLEKQLELIERLRNQGFIIEMDDFGSGYSSLNMLKDIKVDVIKIDMAFLGKTNDEMRAKKILKVMVELSKQLDMPAVVEGVETVEQVEFLKTIGCDIFQGYYFAKPMEVEAFEKRYM